MKYKNSTEVSPSRNHDPVSARQPANLVVSRAGRNYFSFYRTYTALDMNLLFSVRDKNINGVLQG